MLSVASLVFAEGVTVVSEPLRFAAPLSAPAVYWKEVRSTPRPLRLHFLLVDLASPELEVAVAVADDPDGEGPAMATLRKPIEFAKERDFFAAINANAFMHLLHATEEEKKKGWYTGKPVRLFGLTIEDGELRNRHDVRRVPLWINDTGTVRIGPPRTADEPKYAVADWDGPILHDGVVVENSNAARHPRTVAGTDKTGNRLLMLVAEGRKETYSEGLTLQECGEIMQAYGCTDAINFDGGGSSVMLITTNGVLSAVGHPQGRYLRPLPVLLGVRKVLDDDDSRITRATDSEKPE